MNPQPKETIPSFFKVLIGNFSDKLRIPPAFAKKHMKSIPKASILKTRGAGKLFLVSVISNEEGCFFGRGWHKFVEDNQLTVGDFLVFHFLSGSKFEVTIYDNTACEKTLKETGGIQEQGSSVQEQGSSVQEQGSSVQDFSSFKKKRERSPLPSRRPQKASDSTLKQKKNYTMYLLSNRRPVSEEDKLRAFQLADAYTKSSTLPSFIKVMRPTQVHHHHVLSFPKQWGRDHIPNIDENMKIELRVPQLQRKWPVTLKNHKWKFGISKGWYRFVEDNNLEEDDVCVFELKQGGNNRNCKQNIIFDVSIYRVVDEIVPLTAA